MEGIEQNINYEVKKREDIINGLWIDSEELQKIKMMINHNLGGNYSSLSRIKRGYDLK